VFKNEAVKNQPTVVWTMEAKSLVSSLHKWEEFPLFGKEGLGEIL
jgi:hypothetical protein